MVKQKKIHRFPQTGHPRQDKAPPAHWIRALLSLLATLVVTKYPTSSHRREKD